MAHQINTKSKIKSRIIAIIVIVFIAALAALGLFWNRYINKNSLIGKFDTPKVQEVYLLGTLHKDHFNKWFNYSMEDILSVIENVQPDVVFIEAREEYFITYGVIDGPIDMSVVYSYCLDHEIPVELVDWWVVNNNFKSNTTSVKRDDMIFANISNKLKTVDAHSKVLIVCGSGHYYEQTKRFLQTGFEKQKIKDKVSFFDHHNQEFKYPDSIENVWTKRAYFYAYTFPKIVAQDQTLNANIKSEFTDGDHDAYYKQQLTYCDLFSKDKLYLN